MNAPLIFVATLASLSTGITFAAAQDADVDLEVVIEEPVAPESGPPVLLPDVDSVTEHEIEVDGESLRYRATAGTLPLFNESDGEVRARIFFVSYERLEPGTAAAESSDPADAWTLPDPATRPVTFCFNGGPGSSSVWLHLGAWGPR
ncbi:MAG: hypothetical protein GY825_03050, partial [Phycisphaeraceae bacterium]|nr:hypothetical protein [Phycisphaeraceae bacterium]